MEEKNRVQVKIYGQEYTISGQLPREHIIKVADHVDRAMHKLAEELPSCSASSLATLTAVNCADEYYRSLEKTSEMEAKNLQLEKDAQHYVQLWDEAKKNFIQYKEDAQSAVEKKDEIQKSYNAKLAEYKELISDLENKSRETESSFFDLQMENIRLKGELDRLKKEMGTKE